MLFAFWTTSSFEKNAKDYARAMGLWYMEGLTLAAYCVSLNLVDDIARLLNQTAQKEAVAVDN